MKSVTEVLVFQLSSVKKVIHIITYIGEPLRTGYWQLDGEKRGGCLHAVGITKLFWGSVRKMFNLINERRKYVPVR